MNLTRNRSSGVSSLLCGLGNNKRATSTAHIVMEGYLTKSPPQDKLKPISIGGYKVYQAKWHKRWFVLHKPADGLPDQYVLDYFTDRDASNHRGSLQLEHCIAINSQLCYDSRPEFKHLFSLTVKYKDKEKMYFLNAETASEMQQWVRCLCRVCRLEESEEGDESATGPTLDGVLLRDTGPRYTSPSTQFAGSPPPTYSTAVAPDDTNDKDYFCLWEQESKRKNSSSSIPNELAPLPPSTSPETDYDPVPLPRPTHELPVIGVEAEAKQNTSSDPVWSERSAETDYDMPLVTTRTDAGPVYMNEASVEDARMSQDWSNSAEQAITRRPVPPEPTEPVDLLTVERPLSNQSSVVSVESRLTSISSPDDAYDVPPLPKPLSMTTEEETAEDLLQKQLDLAAKRESNISQTPVFGIQKCPTSPSDSYSRSNFSSLPIREAASISPEKDSGFASPQGPPPVPRALKPKLPLPVRRGFDAGTNSLPRKLEPALPARTRHDSSSSDSVDGCSLSSEDLPPRHLKLPSRDGLVKSSRTEISSSSQPNLIPIRTGSDGDKSQLEYIDPWQIQSPSDVGSATINSPPQSAENAVAYTPLDFHKIGAIAKIKQQIESNRISSDS